MSCCNGNCTQGRDCPVRVAKVGRRYPDRVPLSGLIWRRQLRALAKWILICLVVMTVTPAMLWIALA